MEKPYESIANAFENGSYDPHFGIVQSPLRASGRKGLRGAAYVAYRNESGGSPFRPTQEQLLDRQRTFEAFLQNDRSFSTFVPRMCLTPFFEQVMGGDQPSSVYKGVSYNPKLRENGEKLDNLDFFSWAKRVQAVLPDFELIVLDASPYQVLNELSELTWPEEISEDDFAQWFYAQILEGVERDTELSENCALRRSYLEALMQVTGVRGSVVSALELIRDQDAELMRSLNIARAACGVQLFDGRPIEIDSAIEYRRYNTQFAKTYTPAVVAEALYFLRMNGIRAKLGPTSEVAFDNLISKIMRANDQPYCFFWYNRPFERGSTTKNRIYFSDDSDAVVSKLAASDRYRVWVADVLSPLSAERTVEDQVIDIIEQVRRIIDLD